MIETLQHFLITVKLSKRIKIMLPIYKKDNYKFTEEPSNEELV